MPVNEYNMGNQQRDIILSPNEFVFVQSNTWYFMAMNRSVDI